MAELVKIPMSFFEFSVDYERPAIHFLIDRRAVVQGIFDALQPWDPRIDDLEVHTTGKNSEQGVTFKLPAKHVSFFLGAATSRFVRDAADWPSSEETIRILDACLSALVQHGNVVLAKKRAAVAIHLQPQSKTFMDILKPFLVKNLTELEKEPVETMAVVAKWGRRRITLDGSALLANALFVKFEREFEGAITYDAMALHLRADQEELYKILGVEETL